MFNSVVLANVLIRQVEVQMFDCLDILWLCHSLVASLFFSLQCQRQSSARWPAPQLVLVTPNMISWPFLRSVSWRQMESESPASMMSYGAVHTCFRVLMSLSFCLSLCSYIPAVVDHRGGMPCHGTFLLHQVWPSHCTYSMFPSTLNLLSVTEPLF